MCMSLWNKNQRLCLNLATGEQFPIFFPLHVAVNKSRFQIREGLQHMQKQSNSKLK